MFRPYYGKSEKKTCHPWVWNALAIAAVIILALVLFLPKQRGKHNTSVSYIYLEDLLAANYTESTTIINLTDSYVNGTLPSMSWCNFKQLSSLNVGFNYLYGTIPSEIGSCLSNLTELHLGGNFLVGPIPTTIGLLSKLTSLRLQGNYLSGTIPSELGSLTNLEYLSLSDNWIEGNLPTWLYRLKNLKELRVDRNVLNGTVPTALNQMSTLLQDVLLYGNAALTGDVSILCSGNNSDATVTIDSSMRNISCDCCSTISRDEFDSFNYYFVG